MSILGVSETQNKEGTEAKGPVTVIREGSESGGHYAPTPPTCPTKCRQNTTWTNCVEGISCVRRTKQEKIPKKLKCREMSKKNNKCRQKTTYTDYGKNPGEIEMPANAGKCRQK